MHGDTDEHATLFRLLGLRHDGVVYHDHGLEEKLTSIHSARVVTELLA